MKILALEFSSAERSVAVLDLASGCSGLAQETGGRGVRGLALAADALRQAGLEREAIECIAVGLGPGSYTGVRCAIALAQGWQFARQTPIVGVGVVECLVEQAFQAGVRGRINVIVEAQRGEFHCAGAGLDPGGWTIDRPLRLARETEIHQRLGAGEPVIGPDASRWFPAATTVYPSALILATLASRRPDPIPGESLVPISLREIAYVKAPSPRVVPSL